MPNPKVSEALEKIKQKKEKKDKEPEETPEAPEEDDEKDPERISVINALQNAGVYRREVLLRLNNGIILQKEANDLKKETNEKLDKVIELLTD